MEVNSNEPADDIVPEPKPDDPAPEPTSEPGIPERPEGTPEKFWDEEKGELRQDALLSSYKELEKNKHPQEEQAFRDALEFEDGHLKVGEELKDLPPVSSDDPVLQTMVSSAAKHGIPPEAFKGLLMDVLKSSNDSYSEMQAVTNQTLAQQHALIGDNATSVLQGVDVWVNGNPNLDADEKAALLSITAGDGLAIRALNNIRESSGGHHIPMQVRTGEKAVTQADLTARFDNPLQDAETAEGQAFRAETTRMFQDVQHRDGNQNSNSTPGQFNF